MSPLIAAAASSSWAPAAISAVGKLAGGLFGDSGPSFSDQRKHTKRMELARYGWLRDGALKAGFNPLTVLRSTGGQMMQPQNMGSPLSTRAAIGEALETFAGTYAQDAIQQATEDRAQDHWKERYDYQRENPMSPVPATAATGKTSRVETSEPVETGSLAQGFNFPALDQRVPVRLPTGQTAWALKHVLDRYTLGKDEMLTAGDLTEMVGEVVGEGAVLLQADEVLDNLFRAGILFNDPSTGGEINPLTPRQKRRKQQQGGN